MREHNVLLFEPSFKLCLYSSSHYISLLPDVLNCSRHQPQYITWMDMQVGDIIFFNSNRKAILDRQTLCLIIFMDCANQCTVLRKIKFLKFIAEHGATAMEVNCLGIQRTLNCRH